MRLAGDGLEGEATVVPEMHVPGTDCLRASILAVWTDVLSGLLVGQVITPRVPVTLELAVDLYRPARGCGVVRGQNLAKERVQPHAGRHRRARLADGAETGRCQQEIGVGQGGQARLDVCHVHAQARCVAGVQAKLVQDASND